MIKTELGRVIYERPKHVFDWTAAYRIVKNLEYKYGSEISIKNGDNIVRCASTVGNSLIKLLMSGFFAYKQYLSFLRALKFILRSVIIQVDIVLTIIEAIRESEERV